MTEATIKGQADTTSESADGRLLGLIACVLLGVAWAPFLLWHFSHLWALPQYQYFPFVFVGGAFLVWQRLKDAGTPVPGSWLVAWGLALPGLAGLLVAVVLNSNWLGVVSLLLVLPAAIYRIGGIALTRLLLPVWLFFWLVVRLPLRYDNDLVLGLQRLTARLSSDVLDLLGVIHHMSGTVVELPGQQLMVEEACSGVHSLFSAACFTFFLILWWRAPVLRAVLLLATVPFWVVLANVLRVVTVTVAVDRWDVHLEEGWRHELLGLMVFAVAILLILSSDQFLRFLLGGTRGERLREQKAREQQLAEPGEATWGQALTLKYCSRSLASIPLCVLAVILASGQMGLCLVRAAQPAPFKFSGFTLIESITAQAMPESWEDWKQVDFQTEHRNPGSAYGEYSQLWTYDTSTAQVLASCDYPFPEWHELSDCYINNGWQAKGRTVRTFGEKAKEPATVVELDLERPGAQKRGYVAFVNCDISGDTLLPAVIDVTQRWNPLHRLQRRPGTSSGPPSGPVVQLQVLIQGYEPVRQETRDQAVRFLQLMQQRLSPHWRDRAKSTDPTVSGNSKAE